MKFSEMDTKMRLFETVGDYCFLPGIFLVARLDGRSFSRLTKETCAFEVPFDESFHSAMVATMRHLMDCGFQTIYGYTESDEISILFHPDEKTFARKERKFLSVLAGEASVKFSCELDVHAVFDCRISQLPTKQNVVDYFRWRSEDAARNALNAHSYWLLRKQGATATEATEKLKKASLGDKNELLFSRGGINFSKLPLWQRRGVGVYWTQTEKQGHNPITQETTLTTRRTLFTNDSLPKKTAYETFIQHLLDSYATS